VSVAPQPGEWASYWDKLATQTAGNTAPDIIQMGMAYISEYGTRGALLDLSKYGADTAKFTEGTVDSGKINGTLYGVNAGINTATILANPKVLKSVGVDLPDDKTWTWDQAMQIAAQVSSKSGGKIYGLSSFASNDALFGAWLRQQGKELFTESELGFGAADALPWFELMKKLPMPRRSRRRLRSARTQGRRLTRAASSPARPPCACGTPTRSRRSTRPRARR